MRSSVKTDWKIERRWSQRGLEGQVTFSTLDLADEHGVAMLGSAGMGKSWEINRLIQHEKALGRIVLSAEIGRKSASGKLRKCLHKIANELNAGASIFLDGLDEALVANPQATAIIDDWIREIILKGCKIRISCRSAIWPKVLHKTIFEYCHPGRMIVAELQRLCIDDIRQILIFEKLDPVSCLDTIYKGRVSVLSQQPITLKHLIEELKSGTFSSDRSELFKNAVRRMCIECLERDELGTGVSKKLPEHTLIEAAERLAVYVVTTGRELIGIGADIPSTDQLISLNELAQLPADKGQEVNSQLLRALADTGLFIGGPDSGHMQFCERNIAEYLAGSRLARLPFFQSRSILAKDSGWRTGVAGPLRETAAFAASENFELARWIAETDPEVVGLSEVASDELRRIAFEHTTALFRKHILTDSQIARGSVWLSGLFHPNAKERLTDILDERGEGLEDVHAFAIEMSEMCSLHELAPQLGRLFRDNSVHFMTRKDAGYALISFASSSADQELLPLLKESSDFQSQELLGLALRANWPQNVTTDQLLALLSDPVEPSHYGAYQGFLHHLELMQFDAKDKRVEGVTWAIHTLEYGRDSRLLRLATNIALASIEDHGRDGVLSLFVDFVLRADELYLEVFEKRGSYNQDIINRFNSALASDSAIRREIISELVARNLNPHRLKNVYYTVPGLRRLEDFEWLLNEAMTCHDKKIAGNFAQLANSHNWSSSSKLSEFWWNAIECEAIREILFPIPVVELNSELANSMKEHYANLQKVEDIATHAPVGITPPPEIRVVKAIEAAKIDPLIFPGVVRELTLKADSLNYDTSRHVSDMPGWASATENRKSEITDIAKSYLKTFKPIPSASTKQSLNSFSRGPLSSLLLVLERDREWLCKQSNQWWDIWSWQILRDLKLDLHDEQNNPKEELLELLYSKIPTTVAKHMVAMAKRKDVNRNLASILERLVPIADRTLSELLYHGITKREFSGDAFSNVCEYLLCSSEQYVNSLASLMRSNTQNQPNTPTVRIACALLQHSPIKCWPYVSPLFEKRKDVARHVLGKYAYEMRINNSEDIEGDSELAGHMLSALFRAFPPEDDPKHEGAYAVDLVDAAVDLRTHLLNHLTGRKDEKALDAIRQLESEFGSRYNWLRRARAHSEQLHLMNRWQPIPLRAVATILHASERRLLRSGEDVVDAIMYALEEYNRQLHSPPPSTLNSLWSKGLIKDSQTVPIPQEEEHVSDEVSKAIRTVLRDFAVTASREVQISRRRISGAAGRPGSFTDVFVEVPAAGTIGGSRLTVIVEVKRSCNIEVSNALKKQLVDRYLDEEDTNFGIYVVAFFATESVEMRPSDRPKWSSIEHARRDLESQAKDASTNGRLVRSYVLDARIT